MVTSLRLSLRSRSPGGSLAATLVMLMSALPAGTTASAEPLDGLRTRIEQGYLERNLATLESARADLLGLAAAPDASPADLANAAYYAAYARFRQALAAESDRRSARAYLEDCISELSEVVRQQPAHAEARALLGSCHGMSTLYDVLATMSHGLEARRQMAEARRLAPDNPWVVLQDGLADWATPRLFGGNRDLAIAKLERAAGLFTSAMDEGSRIASWGAAEAWHQLAIRYQQLGRTDAAEAAFVRASTLAATRLQLASAIP